jgi:hypothetical protein
MTEMAITGNSSNGGKLLITPKINGRESNRDSRAEKCTEAFHHRGVTVTTTHSYKIHYKYVWKCTICATKVKRHSNSVNLDRVKCRSCNTTTLVQIRGDAACRKRTTRTIPLPIIKRPQAGPDSCLGPIIESLVGLDLRGA